MNETRMIYRPDGVPVSFEWHGGSYIDLYSMEDVPEAKFRAIATNAGGAWEMLSASEGGAPFACINVWDYVKDVPSIPVTREAFIAECDEWLADPDNRRDYGL